MSVNNGVVLYKNDFHGEPKETHIYVYTVYIYKLFPHKQSSPVVSLQLFKLV